MNQIIIAVMVNLICHRYVVPWLTVSSIDARMCYLLKEEENCL